MGARKAGAENVHTDRDQAQAIERATPKGDRVVILPPELDVSGGLPLEQRPALRSAVEGVERGEYAGIIVAYLSRLGRNLAEQLRTYDRVHKAGGQIIVAQEGIDARTRSGRLQRNILAAIHEDEREQHIERFDNLRRWATEAGIWQRRQTPIGYDRDPDTRKLTPNERAPEVLQAFKGAGAGTGVSALARRLGMTPSGVRQMLRNRVYRGELRVGDYVNPDAHPAIVDEETWLAAQTRRPIRPPRGRASAPALLAGLVRCCGCGHIMSRATTKVPVYSCHRHHSGRLCPEPAAITLRLLDDHVTAVALAELHRLQIEQTDDRTEIDRARRQIISADRELAIYLEAVSATDVGVEAFRAGAQGRQAAIDAARAELAQLLARQPARIDGDPIRLWEAFDVAQRNRLLRSLIECVLVERSGGRGRIRPIADRVRVIRYGAGIAPVAVDRHIPVQRIVLPDADDPLTIRI